MGDFEEKNAAFTDAIKMMGRDALGGGVRGLGAAAGGAAVPRGWAASWYRIGTPAARIAV